MADNPDLISNVTVQFQYDRVLTDAERDEEATRIADAMLTAEDVLGGSISWSILDLNDEDDASQ